MPLSDFTIFLRNNYIVDSRLSHQLSLLVLQVIIPHMIVPGTEMSIDHSPCYIQIAKDGILKRLHLIASFMPLSTPFEELY